MVKGSEYRHQYRSRWDKHSAVYEGNVEYRYLRRSDEHNHHSDAFVWDEREWWESDSVSSAGVRPLSGVPLHKYKHQKFNQVYLDKINQYNEERRKNLKAGKNLGKLSGQPPTPEHEKQSKVSQSVEKDPGNRYISCVQRRPESKNAMVQVNGHTTPSTPSENNLNGVGNRYDNVTPTANHATQTHHVDCAKVQRALNEEEQQINKGGPAGNKVAEGSRPKKPVKKPSFKVLGPKQARPRSAPPSRVVQKKGGTEEKKPPFLAFGYKDKERQVGEKKTHNVRASAEVYPAALRAQKRLQAQIDLLQEQAKTAPKYDKFRRGHFNDKPKSDSWDTEYRRNFVGYTAQDYGKPLSGRLYPARCSSAHFMRA